MSSTKDWESTTRNSSISTNLTFAKSSTLKGRKNLKMLPILKSKNSSRTLNPKLKIK
jgi:hypothetical protein